MTSGFTFAKEEKLTGKSHIDRLFGEGKSLGEYPFRVLYYFSEKPETFPARILIAVPGKKFKKATDRNRIRRRIREAYRLNRHLLTEESGKPIPCIHVGIIYTGEAADIPFRDVENKIKTCLVRLNRLRHQV